MTKGVTAEDIGRFVGLPVHGRDCTIRAISSYAAPQPNSMMFVEFATSEVWARLSSLEDALVFCPQELGVSINCASIWSDNPRLPFIRAVNQFFASLTGPAREAGVGRGSVVASSAKIGKNVSIGCNCVIGEDVVIGANTTLLNNVVVSGRTRIGDGCFIKSGAVIGETGFGFCVDEDGVPLQMPHFGGVEIGNGVSIGANSTIERGIFDNTVLSDNVKVDDLVQVGHNVVLGAGAQIAAGTILCGSVKVAERAWVAPNVTVLERTRIGRNALVGLAANVLADVADGAVVVGNPAKPIKSKSI